LAQYMERQQVQGVTYLFESNRCRPYSTRRIRQVVKQYALAAAAAAQWAFDGAESGSLPCTGVVGCGPGVRSGHVHLPGTVSGLLGLIAASLL
jgi:hypothetical protein